MAENLDQKKEQIEIAERLQLKWLRTMERMLDEGTVSATDMATLARVLSSNGWSIDPHQLPQSLKDKMKRSDPKVFDDEVDEPELKIA